jgi:hypothetical protein
VISYGDCDEPEEKSGKLPNTYKFYPLMINISPEIAELMKSTEAKTYLKDIEHHSVKLKRFFDRNCKGKAAYLSGEIDLEHASTTFRHKVLHQALDELFACYITEHPDQHGFFKMEFGDFLEWSANMTLEATCEQQD